MTVLQYSAEVLPLDEATRDRLSALDTTLLSDAMGGRGTLAAAIGPVAPGMKLVGPARIAYSPGSVEAGILAIAACNPGDALMLDGGGGVAHATLGGVMALDAQTRGAAGCVIRRRDPRHRRITPSRVSDIRPREHSPRRRCRARRLHRRADFDGRGVGQSGRYRGR